MNEQIKNLYLAILRDKIRLTSEISPDGVLLWIFNDKLDIVMPIRLRRGR